MNFKELINRVSTEQNIPAAQVKKTLASTFAILIDLVDKAEGFKSPVLTIRPKNIKERKVINKDTGEERLAPAKKVGVLVKSARRKPKEVTQ